MAPPAGERTPPRGPGGADPERVFSVADLGLHLDRLRRSASGPRQTKISLTRLSEATGIPRSTLHTYLTGASLPSADALDAMVLALGVPTGELRAWAGAWERVADLGRGSRVSGRSATFSKFLAGAQELQRRLDRPTDRWFALSRAVAISERLHIGADRQLSWLEIRTTLTALEDGVDRCAVNLAAPPTIDADRVELSSTRNCAPGEHRSFEDLGVRVLELLFGQALAAGETHTLEYRIDYSGALLSAAELARRDVVPEDTDSALRGFRRQGPSFTLEVSFDPAAVPTGLRQVQLEHDEAPENVVRELRLNSWQTTGMAVEHPVAGLHGIRWAWPDGPDGTTGP